MLYQIIAQLVHNRPDGTSTSTGAPTFYLRDDVQGIVSCEHAARIALSILDPFEIAAATGIEFHIHVCDERDNSAHLDSVATHNWTTQSRPKSESGPISSVDYRRAMDDPG
jgi:hypothetical protein